MLLNRARDNVTMWCVLEWYPFLETLLRIESRIFPHDMPCYSLCGIARGFYLKLLILAKVECKNRVLCSVKSNVLTIIRMNHSGPVCLPWKSSATKETRLNIIIFSSHSYLRLFCCESSESGLDMAFRFRRATLDCWCGSVSLPVKQQNLCSSELRDYCLSQRRRQNYECVLFESRFGYGCLV